MDAYDIRLERDGDGWRAHFVTPGGPDVTAAGQSPSYAMLEFGVAFDDAVNAHDGSIDAIPRLPEGES